MNVHFKHTWEEVVQALRQIGEYEYADKIVKEKKLEGIVHLYGCICLGCMFQCTLA